MSCQPRRQQGVLIGVREGDLVVSNVSCLKYSASCMILYRKKNIDWKLVVVYGSPYDEGKVEFIDELHSVLTVWQGPILIGGDFNLCRFVTEKSNGKINQRHADCFNVWVNKWGLIEINPSNGKFTWANNQRNRIAAKLDRVFITTKWEATFPLVRVVGLAKSISDHVPLLVDSGDDCRLGKKKFRFKKWWLEREDFKEVVEKAWAAHCPEGEAIEIWQFRIKIFMRMVRGWATNLTADLNRHKQSIAVEFKWLDLESENMFLDDDEANRMKWLASELDKIWAIDEIKARQRSRDRDILEGDRNTAYFHAIANHRARKKKIEGLQGDSGLVHDIQGILDIAVKYYKGLFKWESREPFCLDRDF
jgi:hypothetical protein